MNALIGEYDHAREAWRMVAELDRRSVFRSEMADALDRLPYRAGR